MSVAGSHILDESNMWRIPIKNRSIAVTSEVLGLRARLSQAWLTSGLLCFVVFIVKLQLLRQFLGVTFKLVNALLIEECQEIKIMAERVLQSPREVVDVASKLITSSVNSSIQGIIDSLRVAIKAVEELIMFTLDIAIGSYACLTISAVNIAANEAINATESVIKVANSTAVAIGKDINKALGKLSDFINGAEGLIDSVEDFITGGSADLHSVNLTVSKLDHLNISSNINSKLESLRKDIPTYDGTKAAVSKLIDEPFRLIELHMNSTNISFQPPPFTDLKTSIVTGCNISQTSAELARLESYVFKIINILCALCALAALCAIFISLWRTKNNWKRLEVVASSSGPFEEYPCSKTDHLRLITASETPFIERLLLSRASQRTRWFVRYIFHSPLLYILCIGLAGIVISLLELIILALVKSGYYEMKQIASITADDLTLQIKRTLSSWRNETNSDITHIESQINNQILGWINQGSQGVNKSISGFMSSINGDIDKAFNGTMFLKPLQAVVYCLIGSKAQKVEEGLTWVHDHSQISLPRIPEQLISQNQTNSTLAKTKSEAMLALQTAIKAIHHQIVVQVIVSSVFISLWLIYTLSASVVAFTANSSPSPSSRRAPAPPSLHRAKGPPPAINVPPLRSRFRVKSPLEKLSDRVSELFSGPYRRVQVSGVPQHASVVFEDPQKNPLNTS